MNKALGNFFRKIFNIFPGEEKNAFLFAILGYLSALAITSCQKFADALFLIHIGADRLPEAYTISACAMLVIASFLLYAFYKFPTYRIFQTVIQLAIASYAITLFFYSLEIGHESAYLWFSLKVIGYLLFTIVIMCYWTFIDQYYHLQDAKRLYTLFTSSIFIGAASTGLIMRSGLLDVSDIFLLVIFVFFLSSFLLRKINKKIPLILHEETEVMIANSKSVVSIGAFIKSILRSKFTLFLMLGNFITYLLLVITEYNYLSAFDDRFAPGPPVAGGAEGTEASLTLFLGQLVASVGTFNLFFGLFFYSRFIRRFGITNLLACTPLLLVIAFSGWLINDTLLFPILGFFVVEGTLYVIDDNNFNLLLNAVPSHLKYKIRVMIESFFEPIGMLASATLLSLFQEQSKILGLILASFALGIALLQRSNYLKAIYQNLSENAIQFQKTLQEWLKQLPPKQQRTAEYRLLAHLKVGDESSQIIALKALLALKDPFILRKLLQIIEKMSPVLKIKFLDLLESSPFATNSIVIETLIRWMLDTDNEDLESSILFYLAKFGLLSPEKGETFLQSKNLLLQGAAILSLRKSGGDLSSQTLAMNRTMAAQQIATLLSSDREQELILGIKIVGIDSPSSDIELLIPFLNHPSLEVQKAAASSIAAIIDKKGEKYISPLLEHLENTNDSEIRISCLNALGKIGDGAIAEKILILSVHFRPNERRLVEKMLMNLGDQIIPLLLEMTKNTSLPDRSRMLSGRILGKLSVSTLRDYLSEIVNKEIDRAYFYFYASYYVKNHLDIEEKNMLFDALQADYHSVIDFIIQLLGVAGEVEDCEILSRSLRSRNPKIRSQVVETLEKTCETPIFRNLRPLVDEMPVEEKIKAYTKAGHPELTITSLLDRIEESKSIADQIIAAIIKSKLKIHGWKESLERLILSSDLNLQHFAKELIDT